MDDAMLLKGIRRILRRNFLAWKMEMGREHLSKGSRPGLLPVPVCYPRPGLLPAENSRPGSSPPDWS